MKNKWTINRGSYTYKGVHTQRGELLYEGNRLKTTLFFMLYPLKRGRIYLIKNGFEKKVKDKHGISRIK